MAIESNNDQNPLHTKQFVAACIRNTGEHPGQRLTGRSTAIALQVISDCIKSPYTWHKVKDHFPTREADRWLLSLVQDTVRQLELKHFYFHREGYAAFGAPTSNPTR